MDGPDYSKYKCAVDVATETAHRCALQTDAQQEAIILHGIIESRIMGILIVSAYFRIGN